MIYAYLPADFGPGMPEDPVTVAQTRASFSVTLARGAEAVPLSLEGGQLAAPARLAGQPFAAGDTATSLWSLVDAARGVRLTAYTLAAAGGRRSLTVLASGLPLAPGQSLTLSLPVGPGAGTTQLAGGFAEGTRILTEAGTRPVEEIRTGEKVWTEEGGFRPVLWHGIETLPARGLAAPVRLRRGLLGLSDDLLLAGAQHVRIETGAGPVLVPASAFEAAGQATRDFGATMRWHQLLLPGHTIIFAHGLPCESLWSPALLRQGAPADWPADHTPPDAPVLPRLSEAEALGRLG